MNGRNIFMKQFKQLETERTENNRGIKLGYNNHSYEEKSCDYCTVGCHMDMAKNFGILFSK